MSKLDIYEKPLKEYCKANNLDYKALSGMELVWGIDSLEIRNSNKESVLKIYGYDPDDLLFEETDITQEYSLYQVAT